MRFTQAHTSVTGQSFILIQLLNIWSGTQFSLHARKRQHADLHSFIWKNI